MTDIILECFESGEVAHDFMVIGWSKTETHEHATAFVCRKCLKMIHKQDIIDVNHRYNMEIRND